MIGMFGLCRKKGSLAVLYISKDKQRDENEKKSGDQKVEGDTSHGKDLRGVHIARSFLKASCIYEQITSHHISNQTKEGLSVTMEQGGGLYDLSKSGGLSMPTE